MCLDSPFEDSAADNNPEDDDGLIRGCYLRRSHSARHDLRAGYSIKSLYPYMVGYTHFMDESVEAQRGKVSCLRSWTWEGEEPNFGPRSSYPPVLYATLCRVVHGIFGKCKS